MRSPRQIVLPLLRGIHVSVEIDEGWIVIVKKMMNANNRLAEALKGAIEQWQFYPAIIDGHPRCIETELPMTLIQP